MMTTALRKAGPLALLVLGVSMPALHAGGKPSRFTCAAGALTVLGIMQFQNYIDISNPVEIPLRPLAKRQAVTGDQGSALNESSTGASTGFSLPPEWYLQPADEIARLQTDLSTLPSLPELSNSTRPLVQKALALLPGRNCSGRTWPGDSPLPPTCQGSGSPMAKDDAFDPEKVVASLGDRQILEHYQQSAKLRVVQFFQCICRTLDEFAQTGGKGGDATLEKSLEKAGIQRNDLKAEIGRYRRLLEVMWEHAKDNPELWTVPQPAGHDLVESGPAPYPVRMKAIEEGIREMESGKRTFDLVIKPVLKKVRRNLKAAAKAEEGAERHGRAAREPGQARPGDSAK